MQSGDAVAVGAVHGRNAVVIVGEVGPDGLVDSVEHGRTIHQGEGGNLSQVDLNQLGVQSLQLLGTIYFFKVRISHGRIFFFFRHFKAPFLSFTLLYPHKYTTKPLGCQVGFGISHFFHVFDLCPFFFFKKREKSRKKELSPTFFQFFGSQRRFLTFFDFDFL